jgi:hypothetical protein
MGRPRHDPSSRPSLARALASDPVRLDVTEPTALDRDSSAERRPVNLVRIGETTISPPHGQ